MILRRWERQGNYTLHDMTLHCHNQNDSQAVGETEIIPYMTLHCHNQNDSQAMGETGKLYLT